MRQVLGYVRLLSLVLFGVLLALLIWPLISAQLRDRTELWFANRILTILRVKVCAHFEVPEANFATHGPYLLYCNHVSWLDIFALNSLCPLTFIAKSEIAEWPLAGMLAKRSGTLFIERGKRHAVRQVIQESVEVLQTGRTVAVFPEGTTGAGDQLLPFHSNFIQPAMLAQVQVVPVSLQYQDANGKFSSKPAFLGEQALIQNIQVLLGAREGYTVRLVFHAPIATEGFTRHALSDKAREVIQASLLS
ncbi:MAG: 1-acyl-sn-glycerol-3-phosphate acyltransferase [Limnobacter sp.]|nr:1-acyl-sn-glycerol-3-phosphate acyltransferase [Limnobacter sp.]